VDEIMNKLSATFERKVTLLEFDREVQKLLKNFNQNQRLLIEVKIKGENIIVNVKDNPNQTEPQRWIWDIPQ
jgi:DNA/RNA endonuclease YhcR with UshA esterase domain